MGQLAIDWVMLQPLDSKKIGLAFRRSDIAKNSYLHVEYWLMIKYHQPVDFYYYAAPETPKRCILAVIVVRTASSCAALVLIDRASLAFRPRK